MLLRVVKQHLMLGSRRGKLLAQLQDPDTQALLKLPSPAFLQQVRLVSRHSLGIRAVSHRPCTGRSTPNAHQELLVSVFLLHAAD